MTAASRRLSILEQCQAQHYIQFACGSVYVCVMPIMLTVCMLIHYALYTVNGLSHAEYMCHGASCEDQRASRPTYSTATAYTCSDSHRSLTDIAEARTTGSRLRILLLITP